MSTGKEKRKMGNPMIEEEVYNYIKENPGTWVEDIARKLGYHRATVSRYVTGLVSGKKVKAIRKGQLDELWPSDSS